MLSRRPVPARHITRLETPKDTNGNGTPVKGITAVTTAMFTMACSTNQQVTPRAIRLAKRSGAPLAMRNPRQATIANNPSTTSVPIKPSSSPTTAKIASVWAAGSTCFVCP